MNNSRLSSKTWKKGKGQEDIIIPSSIIIYSIYVCYLPTIPIEPEASINSEIYTYVSYHIAKHTTIQYIKSSLSQQQLFLTLFRASRTSVGARFSSSRIIH